MAIYYELFLDETGDFTGIQKDANRKYTDVKKSANVGFLVKSFSKSHNGSFSLFFADSKRHIRFNAKATELPAFTSKIFESMCRISYSVLNPERQLSKGDRNKLLNTNLKLGGYCFDAISGIAENKNVYPIVIDHWGATVTKPDNALSSAARSYIQPKYFKAFIDCLDASFAGCWQFVAFHSKQRAQLEQFERNKKSEAITALYYVDSLIDGVTQLWYKLYKQHRTKKETFYLNVFIAGKLVNGVLVDTPDFLNDDKKQLKLLIQNLADYDENFDTLKKAFANSLRMQIFNGYSIPGQEETKINTYKDAYAAILQGENYQGNEIFYKHILLTVADNLANSYLQYVKENDYLEQNKTSDLVLNYSNIFDKYLKSVNKLIIFKTNLNLYIVYRDALKRGKKLTFAYDPTNYLIFWDNGEEFAVWKDKYDSKLEQSFTELIKPLENDKFRKDFINKTVLYLKKVLPVNKNEKYLHILGSLYRIYSKLTEQCQKTKGYVPKSVAVFGLDLALFKVYLCQNLGKIAEADNLLNSIEEDVNNLANNETYIDRRTTYTELKMNGLSDRFRYDLVEKEYYELEARLKSAKRALDYYIAILRGQSLPRKKPTAIFTKDLGKIHNMFIEAQITRAIHKHFRKKTIDDSFEKDLDNYNNYKRIYMAGLNCLPDYKDRDFTYSNFLRLVAMYDKKHNVAEQILLASVSEELFSLSEPAKGNWAVKDFFKKKEHQNLNFEELVKCGLFNQSNGTVRLFVLLNYLTVLRKMATFGNAEEYNSLLKGLKNANIVLDDQLLKNNYPLCIIYWRIAEIILSCEGNENFTHIIEIINIVKDHTIIKNDIKAGIYLINKSIKHLENMGADEISNLRIMAIKIAVLAYTVHFMNSLRGRIHYNENVLNTAITNLKSLYDKFSKNTTINAGDDKTTFNLFAPVMERCKDGAHFNKEKIIKYSKYLAQCVPDYF